MNKSLSYSRKRGREVRYICSSQLSSSNKNDIPIVCLFNWWPVWVQESNRDFYISDQVGSSLAVGALLFQLYLSLQKFYSLGTEMVSFYYFPSQGTLFSLEGESFSSRGWEWRRWVHSVPQLVHQGRGKLDGHSPLQGHGQDCKGQQESKIQ